MEHVSLVDDGVRISFPIVDLPEGEVLLASLEELERTVTYIDSDLVRHERDARELQGKIDEKLRTAGARLVREHVIRSTRTRFT